MTVHDLHDALTLLPADLITATDKLRTTPGAKVIPWKRLVSLAACLVLVLSVTLVFQKKLLPGISGGKMESTAEAPAAAAPMEQGDMAFAEAPAADMESAVNSTGQITDEKAAEEELCIDHSHRFAEETEEDKPAEGYCGNMLTTISVAREVFTISGSDSVTMTDILTNLNYDPDQTCRCMAEFTVDTEMLTDIHVNLTEGFARCEKGQAALTEEQAKTIQEIIDRLQ